VGLYGVGLYCIVYMIEGERSWFSEGWKAGMGSDGICCGGSTLLKIREMHSISFSCPSYQMLSEMNIAF
jgi:hypothetical protein